MAAKMDITDTSSEKRATIELTLRNLSLSVIPPPSLLTQAARRLKLIRDPSRSPEASHRNPDTSKATDEEANINRNDRDLRNVGINIFREVDLTVKPGQGTLGQNVEEGSPW